MLDKITELERYNKVNQTNSLNELAEVILSFADQNGNISGKTTVLDAKKMADYCKQFNSIGSKFLTRKYGIRQQAMMLSYYGK